MLKVNSGDFIVHFNQISHIGLVFPLLGLEHVDAIFYKSPLLTFAASSSALRILSATASCILRACS